MTSDKTDDSGSRVENETERRFNETVRNLLNTPPKPHKPAKDKPAAKEASYPAGKRTRAQPS